MREKLELSYVSNLEENNNTNSLGEGNDTEKPEGRQSKLRR